MEKLGALEVSDIPSFCQMPTSQQGNIKVGASLDSFRVIEVYFFSPGPIVYIDVEKTYWEFVRWPNHDRRININQLDNEKKAGKSVMHTCSDSFT